MRKLVKTLSELSGGYDEEDQQLLNPNDKPADFGISLTQLRHLSEVFTPKSFVIMAVGVLRPEVLTAMGVLRPEVLTACTKCADKGQR